VCRKTKRWARFACLFLLGSTTSAQSEQSLSNATAERLRIPLARIHSSQFGSQVIDFRSGIGPDEAATIALYSNPALRSIRDRRGLAVAQLIQAGILPNAVVSYARDFVTGGNTVGTTTAYTFSAGWEFSALIPFLPKQTAARKNLRSVDLDVAWQEWQAAMNARVAVYRVLALDAQVARAREANRGLQESTSAMREALNKHEKTVLDLSAVESASQDSLATMLGLEQEFERQRLGLNKALGAEPTINVRLRAGLTLPTHVDVAGEHDLLANVESRRLDLLGLRQGYESQDATVRAAILAQFPKMSVAFVRASDTTERLKDEYNQRVFEARSDLAVAIADIRSLDRQVTAAQEGLPVLERLVSSAETAREQGNTDVLSYYTARGTLLQKRIQLIKLQQQLLEARTALEIASGRYLPSNASLKER